MGRKPRVFLGCALPHLRRRSPIGRLPSASLMAVTPWISFLFRLAALPIAAPYICGLNSFIQPRFLAAKMHQPGRIEGHLYRNQEAVENAATR